MLLDAVDDLAPSGPLPSETAKERARERERETAKERARERERERDETVNSAPRPFTQPSLSLSPSPSLSLPPSPPLSHPSRSQSVRACGRATRSSTRSTTHPIPPGVLGPETHQFDEVVCFSRSKSGRACGLAMCSSTRSTIRHGTSTFTLYPLPLTL